jgi:hypothetical protein
MAEIERKARIWERLHVDHDALGDRDEIAAQAFDRDGP